MVHPDARRKAITVLLGQQREDESMHTRRMTHAHNGKKAGHRVGVQEASLGKDPLMKTSRIGDMHPCRESVLSRAGGQLLPRVPAASESRTGNLLKGRRRSM